MAASSIPRERVLAFFTAAAATRKGTVLVAFTGGRAVRRQYQRGVKAAGGKPENLRFLSIEEMAARGR